MASTALSYVIDEDDRLVKVSSGFYAFAAENGWDGSGAVLGRSLWEFVAGEDMQKLQRLLLRRIRDEAASIELPFRCDGPETTRTMSMRISARPPGRYVTFSARTIAEQPRDEPQPLLAATAPRDDTTLTMCGWCDRFLVGDDWVTVEEAATALELFLLPRLPTISHGVCPACTEMLMAA